MGDSGRPSIIREEDDRCELLAAAESRTVVPVQPVSVLLPVRHSTTGAIIFYDVWAAQRHLVTKEFLHPDEVPAAPARFDVGEPARGTRQGKILP